MKRAFFELFAKDLRKQGFSNEKIRDVLKGLIEKGLAEGNDKIGYIITEKGVIVIEKIIYGKMGVI